MPCKSQEDCETAAMCTDIEYTRQRSDSVAPYAFTDGACFTSGVMDVAHTEIMCGENSVQPPIGCIDLALSEAECISGQASSGVYVYREWLTTAMSESECVRNSPGRYGCRLVTTLTDYLAWYNSSDCECAYGESKYAWEWVPGVWSGGTVRVSTWLKANVESKYAPDENTLSFLLLDSINSFSSQYVSSFDIKSQVICRNTVGLSYILPIVCDCFGDAEVPASASVELPGKFF